MITSLIRSGVVSLFLACCLMSEVSAHGTGTISGRVTETGDGQGLAGTNVFLENTIYGTSTGPDGSYKITHVPEGTYTIVFSYIGYTTVRDTVIVHENEKVVLNVNMEMGIIELSPVMIEVERPYSAASSRAVRQIDLKIRPRRSAQDMLQLAPGVIIAQHGGGGKAEQIYIRGFDCDHGTDIALFSDGMPVNMVTHGHGQGYADMHFVIPEIIKSIDVYKGPYFARYGNFSTGGSLSFETEDHVANNLVRVEGGAFNTRKFTTILQIPSDNLARTAYMAAQFYDTDGPFESPQDFQRFNVFGKFHMHLSEDSKLALSLDAFSSGWNQSGQIPDRSVKNGLISRFGAIDELEGGTTSRQNINLKYSLGETTKDEFIIQAYATRYNFKLFSNFTFFLNDPDYGDMIEQTDTRNIFGLNSFYRFRRHLGHIVSSTTIGAGFRNDNISVALWKSPDRVRQIARVNADVAERNLFLWFEQEFIFSPVWRMQLGLRQDYFTFDVNDKLENIIDETDLPHASGYSQEAMFNPKANVVFSPWRSTDIFLNTGSSFHSNDARNVVQAQRMDELEHGHKRRGYTDAQIDSAFAANNFDRELQGIKTLPRAVGAEIGVRTNIGKNLTLGFAAWILELEEELVFVGDEGTTEISGATRRIGVDVEARLQITNWLWADVDINYAKGRFVDEPEGANDIPLAPRLTSTGGFTVLHPSGWQGALRYRYIGDRPANEFNTVTALGSIVYNAVLAYNFKNMRMFVTVENILDSDVNEAQFDTESRLYHESDPVSELHFTPGNPRNVQAGISYAF